MMAKTADAAAGRWHGILSSLGIDPSYLTGRHGPCPICGEGRDRFRFDDKEGRGTYFCSQCGSGDGFTLLMNFNGWDFRTAAKEVEAIIGVVEFKPIPKKKDPLPRLKKIAAGAQVLTGEDPATRYLMRRGLKATPDELKYHPGLDYYDGKTRIGVFPCLLAVVKDVAGNNLTYHATYLSVEGAKANVPNPKKILPPLNPISGGAIRLFGAGDHICLSEGIETAIAAHEATGLPSWATISAGGMESFDPPNGIRKITIFADNDKSYTGQKAAYVLANRLRVKHKIDTDVIIPIKEGHDYCDEWIDREGAA